MTGLLAVGGVPGDTYELLTHSGFMFSMPGSVVAWHFLPMEKPDEVHEALLDLLDRVRR